ncbi:DinB family protein [Deinococcus yunweiensis]|uniref:DinB family protein n=1 Tax=Deinococcus yunweiensis TaxID=367282 RepID=UPI00398EB379
MTQDSGDRAAQHPIDGILDILKEAVEGGTPGQGTAFLDGTKADGSDNHGLLAILESVDAVQASHDVNGTTIAGHARHAAFHLEVIVRWERDGDRGPFDWKGSFLPKQVEVDEWAAVQTRVRDAYEALVAFARSRRDAPVNGDVTGGLSGAVAHVAYHLGSIRQMVKVVS